MSMDSAGTDGPGVLIADDERLFRSGLAKLLEVDARVTVVGEAQDGQQAIDMVSSLTPNVVLMDLKMPRVDGIEATAKIRTKHPEVKVLILTALDTDKTFVEAMKAGANGYVLKDSALDAIVFSILAVASGERVLGPTIADRALFTLTGTTPQDHYDGLTLREVEILRLLSGGMANKQIARTLKMSEKTVRDHVTKTYGKLGVTGRAQATHFAIRKGLVEP